MTSFLPVKQTKAFIRRIGERLSSAVARQDEIQNLRDKRYNLAPNRNETVSRPRQKLPFVIDHVLLSMHPVYVYDALYRLYVGAWEVRKIVDILLTMPYATAGNVSIKTEIRFPSILA